MTDEESFLKELRKEFLEEVTFMLEECEQSFLHLEDPQSRDKELDKVLRLAHSLKGGGAAVGFKDLAEFAHHVEDLLCILRTQPQLGSPEIISLLLRCGDAFKHRVDMLKSGSNAQWDIDALKNEIKIAAQKLREIEFSKSTPATPALPPKQTHPILQLFDSLNEVTSQSIQEANQANKPEDKAAVLLDAPVPAEATSSASVIPSVFAAPAASAPPSPTTPSLLPEKESAAPKQEIPKNEVVSNSNKGETKSLQSSSVKVDTDRIDNVLELIGELVVIKSQLDNKAKHYTRDQELGATVSSLDKAVRDLQSRALSMRMMPVKNLFHKVQRTVHDLTGRLNKPIDLHLEGEETELDRNMVEMLSDPLLHILRNAIDHGIESHEKRASLGKPEKGKVSIKSKQVGGRVLIIIEDDGGGIHRSKIIAKAKSKGLIPPAKNTDSLTDREVFNLIFLPGFSTAEVVSDISGRGVGLDVVKTNIEKLKGSVTIESQENKGSRFIISLPMTTSITDGMLVSVSGQRLIIPMENIRDLIKIGEGQLSQVTEETRVIRVRDALLSLHSLDQLLRKLKDLPPASHDGKNSLAVIVEHSSGVMAIEVDAVLGQTQVVLKPLSSQLGNPQGIAGAAILGDGSVALVLDVHSLYTAFNESPPKTKATTHPLETVA